MKTNPLNCSVLTLASAAILVLASCKSEPSGERSTMVSSESGVPGGTVVETYKVSATVTGIDKDDRKITLVTRDGKKTTYKAGPEVVNFDQIHIGDQLKVTTAQEIVVYMADQGPASSDGGAAVVTLAPKGAKPAAYMATTVQVTAKVKAIDLKRHKATLEFPDGTSKTFPVRADVDLTKRNVGEQVVIRSTEAAAVMVEKP